MSCVHLPVALHVSSQGIIRHAAPVQVEPEYAMRVEDQKRQLEALTILDACMSTLEPQQLLAYEGLCVHVYHPEVSPIGSQAFVEDDGMYTYRTSRINSFVGEDGVLHLVSHRASLSRALLELDTEKARLLSQVGDSCKCVGWNDAHSNRQPVHRDISLPGGPLQLLQLGLHVVILVP
jgi:hypothetical protein